jgi:hypothetical protein
MPIRLSPNYHLRVEAGLLIQFLHIKQHMQSFPAHTFWSYIELSTADLITVWKPDRGIPPDMFGLVFIFGVSFFGPRRYCTVDTSSRGAHGHLSSIFMLQDVRGYNFIHELDLQVLGEGRYPSIRTLHRE